MLWGGSLQVKYIILSISPPRDVHQYGKFPCFAQIVYFFHRKRSFKIDIVQVLPSSTSILASNCTSRVFNLFLSESYPTVVANHRISWNLCQEIKISYYSMDSNFAGLHFFHFFQSCYQVPFWGCEFLLSLYSSYLSSLSSVSVFFDSWTIFTFQSVFISFSRTLSSCLSVCEFINGRRHLCGAAYPAPLL